MNILENMGNHMAALHCGQRKPVKDSFVCFLCSWLNTFNILLHRTSDTNRRETWWILNRNKCISAQNSHTLRGHLDSSLKSKVVRSWNIKDHHMLHRHILIVSLFSYSINSFSSGRVLKQHESICDHRRAAQRLQTNTFLLTPHY